MIPTKLIKRGVIRLVFVIPVLWFSFFLLSFYIDDILNSNIDEMRTNNKRNIAISNKKNMYLHNFMKGDFKARDNLITGKSTDQLKGNQKEIDNSIQSSVTKRHLISTNITKRHDSEDDTEKGRNGNKDRQVLAAPNHPQLRLIDPNAPGLSNNIHIYRNDSKFLDR